MLKVQKFNAQGIRKSNTQENRIFCQCPAFGTALELFGNGLFVRYRRPSN